MLVYYSFSSLLSLIFGYDTAIAAGVSEAPVLALKFVILGSNVTPTSVDGLYTISTFPIMPD